VIEAVKYPIMETFTSVQGEGVFTGVPSFFIRLAGCDVGCVWCDVKESWDKEKHPLVALDTLVEAAIGSGVKVVIVTGGEPTMHDLGPLTEALRYVGLRVHLETSGTQKLTGLFDWITFSPKKFKAPLEEYFQLANELKVVINHKSDIEWSHELSARMNESAQWFMQPEWDKRELMLSHIFDWVLKNPHWRVGLQIHKYMGVE
jgi:organic radical activating enzyme